MRRTLLLTLALLVALAAPGTAGFKIEQTMSGMDEQAVIFVDANRIKIESGQEVIFNIEDNILYMLVPERQIYWSGTPEELVTSIRSAMESAMEGMLAQVPEDQRDQYREQMKSMGMFVPGEDDGEAEEHDVAIEKTGNAEEIAGYATEEYQILVDGELVEKVWMADDVPVSDEIDLKRFAEYAAAMKQFSGEYAYETSDEYLSRMASGYPMRTQPFRQGQEGPETEVTALIEMDVPDAKFEVPEGYEKVTLMELQGGMGAPRGGAQAPGTAPPPQAPGMP
ncbi:MAG: DUF4412 domain-containing protein [Candidatus Eisenbacteria bacterium]|nr:DUF4412 domain-containing protein [Candidatus Eisenbacteria bacterium]